MAEPALKNSEAEQEEPARNAVSRNRFRQRLPQFHVQILVIRWPKQTIAGGQTRRSTIIFLISAIALAGFRPLGQVWAQFMIVWQR